ncbi:hypothetical protein TNCV_1520601 [Trichonephila clavipes]|nr:hypothetical protein TNCV_1520601 [Trichonephila clavipes]
MASLFLEGRESVKDDECSGRSQTSHDAKDIYKVSVAVFKSRLHIKAQIAESVGIYGYHRLGYIMHRLYGDRFNSCRVIYSQFGLAIHQNDHQTRRRFVEWAQNEIAVVPDFHKRILFSDEAHFWLNGYVNKQNCRIWSEANPQVYVETPLHPEN